MKEHRLILNVIRDRFGCRAESSCGKGFIDLMGDVPEEWVSANQLEMVLDDDCDLIEDCTLLEVNVLS